MCIRDRSPTKINGYDFVENDNLPYDIDFVSSPFFPRYHGTSVASIIIKEAPKAVIVPYKFSRKNPCTFADIIKKLSDSNIKIALLAMGSNNINDWQCFLKEAKKSQDVLFIVTAGNNDLNIEELNLNRLIDKNKLFNEPAVDKDIENESSYTPAEREQMNLLNNIETIETNENN